MVLFSCRFFDNSLKNPDEDGVETRDASRPQEIRRAVERWKEDSDYENVEKRNRRKRRNSSHGIFSNGDNYEDGDCEEDPIEDVVDERFVVSKLSVGFFQVSLKNASWHVVFVYLSSARIQITKF